MKDDPDGAGLRAWLEAFAASVRGGDYAGARGLFDAEVVGFGTRTVMMRGLDDLQARQWRYIWESTRGFGFDPASVVMGRSQDASQGWIAGRWSSEGRGPDGGWFARHGRASFVLSRRDGAWRCVHSHHSLDPAPEPLAEPT